MEKHIYFVRHGESESNADGIHRGPASMLNEKGKTQAKAVAERIGRIGIDALITSPFPRARDTAAAIAATTGLRPEESELFVERRRPSSIVGLHQDDPIMWTVMKEVSDGYLEPGHRHSDEENLDDLRERSNAALAFLLQHEAARICVVTHGLFLRVLFAAATKGNFDGADLRDAMRGLETDNTGVSYFRYEHAFFASDDTMHWRVIQWNDSAHLG